MTAIGSNVQQWAVEDAFAMYITMYVAGVSAEIAKGYSKNVEENSNW